MGMPIFMKKITDMKAWELYIGQSIWLFVMGMIFYTLRYLLDMLFIETSNSIIFNTIERLGTANMDALDGNLFAKSILGSPTD